MGYHVVVEGGHVTISEGDTVLQSYFLSNWKDLMEEALNGGDYVAPSATRQISIPRRKRGPKPTQDHDQGQRTDDNASSEADCGDKSHEIGQVEYGIFFGWNGYRKVTTTQLAEDFNAAQAMWDSSPESQALIAQLKSLKEAKSKVTNIVALGIGSLHDMRPNDPASVRRSRVQLAVVLTISSYLNDVDTKDTLPIVAQDPDYSQIEKKFLRSLNIIVVDDPDAFSCINSNSLVLNIGTYFDLVWSICVGNWPAAMITSDWGNPRPELCEHVPPFCVQRVHSMFEQYHEAPFLDVDRRFEDWKRINLYRRK